MARAAAYPKLKKDAAGTARRVACEAAAMASQGEAEAEAPRLNCFARICCCPCLSMPCAGCVCPWWCKDAELPLHRQDVDRQKALLDKLSALYCLSMPASLALLPTLHTIIPKDQHVLLAYTYGAIFSSASVGLVLSLHALDRFDLELARFLSRFSLVALSALVVTYLYFALSPDHLAFLWLCSGILAVGHGYAWIRSCCFGLEDPSFQQALP